MTAIASQRNITLNCEVQVPSVNEEDVFWYKLNSDILPQFPPGGASCGELLTPGSGSGSGDVGLNIPRNEFNITGEVVANGSYSLTFDPIQFGDEGYYVCVVQSGSEQQCFSDHVTVAGE